MWFVDQTAPQCFFCTFLSYSSQCYSVWPSILMLRENSNSRVSITAISSMTPHLKQMLTTSTLSLPLHQLVVHGKLWRSPMEFAIMYTCIPTRRKRVTEITNFKKKDKKKKKIKKYTTIQKVLNMAVTCLYFVTGRRKTKLHNREYKQDMPSLNNSNKYLLITNTNWF